MNELEVRIVKLEPMRVASAHAYSEGPEQDALEKLVAWAKPKGLLENPEKHRVFGFNNPDPSPGSPNYGYEFWITIDSTVGSDAEPEGEIKMKEFPGGLYAVARCEVKEPWKDIQATWKRLVAWRENSQYQGANHQWLEEHLGPLESSEEFVLDLYLPIAE
jgi:AraC family transcriptional regulator